MNSEPIWISSLKAAVRSARAERVKDDAIAWKFNRILTGDKQPPRGDGQADMIAGIVEIVVHEPDNPEQLPIFITIPMSSPGGKPPAK